MEKFCSKSCHTPQGWAKLEKETLLELKNQVGVEIWQLNFNGQKCLEKILGGLSFSSIVSKNCLLVLRFDITLTVLMNFDSIRFGFTILTI